MDTKDKKAFEIALKVISMFEKEEISLETKREVVCELAKIFEIEELRDDGPTYDFLKQIPKIGTAANRIADKYPTVRELRNADSRCLRTTYHVGKGTMQRIHELLTKEGFPPKWKP